MKKFFKILGYIVACCVFTIIWIRIFWLHPINVFSMDMLPILLIGLTLIGLLAVFTNEKSGIYSLIKRFLKVLGCIISFVLFAIIIMRLFFLSPFHIPSGAMIPTLLIGDNLWASKTVYGYSRYSFPNGVDINYLSGRIWGAEPKLGDVAVFRSVVEPDINFIKRVVGLPGDRIQMQKGILYINDVPCPVEPDGECVTINDDRTTLKATQYTETLPNGLKHPIIKQDPFGEARYDNTPVFTVPAYHYFMMGDNRDRSNDSRVQQIVGYIPLENFVGRASFIFFSPERHIGFWEVWKWRSTALYNRIGQGIH